MKLKMFSKKKDANTEKPNEKIIIQAAGLRKTYDTGEVQVEALRYK